MVEEDRSCKYYEKKPMITLLISDKGGFQIRSITKDKYISNELIQLEDRRIFEIYVLKIITLNVIKQAKNDRTKKRNTEIHQHNRGL